MTCQPRTPRCAAMARKGLLRFLTCGSVDDGKSTLIGRLLYDTKLIFEDQLAALEQGFAASTAPPATTSTSRCWSTAWRPSASRASPSTSPTASSPRRGARFIVADTPGHEQYTRNMATGASNCRPRRHAGRCAQGRAGADPAARYIARCSASATSVLAVNKIDLVDFDAGVFERIVADFAAFAARLGFTLDHADPDVGALRRQRHRSGRRNMPWYHGPDAARASGDGRRRQATAPKSRSASRCNGSTGRTSISAAFPAPSPAARSARATQIVVAASGKDSQRRAHRHARTAICREAERRRCRHADAGRRDRRRARRRARATPTRPAGGGRPVRGPSALDGRRGDAARPLLPHAHRHRWTPATVTAIKHKIDVNTLRAARRARRSASTRSAFCNLSTAHAGRLRSLRGEPRRPAPSSWSTATPTRPAAPA